MKTLAQIYQRHSVTEDTGSGDKGTVHSYIDIYADLLEPFRHKACTFMEIGLARGLSLAMWREYLPLAHIVGVDTVISFDPEPHLKHVGTTLVQGDATKPEFLKELDGVNFDVVIDDGSHQTQDQIATFKLIKDRMNPGGLYIIEDVNGLEQVKPDFARLYAPMEIYDLRKIKGRFDDVLIVYNF